MKLGRALVAGALIALPGASEPAGPAAAAPVPAAPQLPVQTRPPVADFAFHLAPQVDRLGVQFVDQSRGGRVERWSWDIEDYDPSGALIHVHRDVANPFHAFSKPDGGAHDPHDPHEYARTYSVTLTVWNASGSSIVTKEVAAELHPSRTVFVPSVAVESGGAQIIQDALDGPFPEGLHGAPGTVRLGSGVYQIDASIALHSGQKLAGVSPPSATWNMGQPQDGTILQFTGPTSDFAIEVDPDAQWCEIRDLFILDGNLGPPFAEGGIHLVNAWHTTIENVLIEEFGSDQQPGSAELIHCGHGVLIEGGLFTRILNCRMRACDVFVEFSASANHNLIQGGHYTMDRTNSAVVIRSSTSNTILGASFEQPGSCLGERFYSFFEFIGGSHTSVLANRLEVCDANPDVGTSSWHYSFDAQSENNMLFANQFTDFPNPLSVGKAAIKNVAGAAVRERTVSGTVVSNDDLGAGGIGAVIHRFAVPQDWVGTALTFGIDHVLAPGGVAGAVDLDVSAAILKPGVAPPPAAGYDQTVHVAGAAVAATLGTLSVQIDGLAPVEASHRYVEVEIRRGDGSGAGPVSIENVTMTYRATDTPFHRL